MTACDGQGLLRAILERPEEDGLRLIYADWVDDAGDPDRAEFVRLGVAGGTPKASMTQAERWFDSLLPGGSFELRRRRGGWYLWYYGQSYYGERRCSASVARGFVDRMTLPLDTFEEHAKTIFAAQPVTRVILSNVFMSCPAWGDPMVRYYGYYRRGHYGLAGWVVPEAVFLRLPDAPVEREDFKAWTTKSAATDALSAALADYGRDLAGLPPLKRLPDCYI